MIMSDGQSNFDDSELEDIMREMEELEKAGGATSPKGASADKRPSALSSIIPPGPHHLNRGQRSVSPPLSPSPPTSMSLNIKGSIELELRFDTNGHKVTLSVNESGTLEVTTQNGAKFSLPLHQPTPKAS